MMRRKRADTEDLSCWYQNRWDLIGSSPLLGVRTGRAFAAKVTFCSRQSRLPCNDTSIGDMCRAIEDTALIRPNQGSAAATIDCDGNRIRQVATAARDTAKDVVGADSINEHNIICVTRIIES